MERADEARAIEHVRERLEAEFPSLDTGEVHAAVTSAHKAMTGPVRDFVPVLVERDARERLSRLLP